ncbi:MAG TPA: hypothetical protein VLF94_05355 [Chlamydiales bacterium]|nr:hypothetical protein [Chlamydiales bacterium]
MAAAVAHPPIIINGRDFTPQERNPGRLFDRVVSFAKSSYGSFRVLQLLERVARAAVYVLKAMGNVATTTIEYVEKRAGDLGKAWQLLIVTRCIEVTRSAKKAIVEWIHPDPLHPPVDANRDKVQKVHEIAEAAAAYGYFTSWFAGSTPLRNVADTANLVSDVTDLQMAAQDWYLAKKHLEIVDKDYAGQPAAHNQFAYTMRHAFIKIVKAVTSVTTGVLGLMALALGTAFVSPVFLLGCGIVATTAAMWAHFYKESRSLDTVDFFAQHAPVVFAAAAAG